MSKTDDFCTSDGTRYEFNRGIIGISPDLKIFEGYDGQIAGEWNLHTCEQEPLPARHVIEMAEEAIRRWTALLDKSKARLSGHEVAR